MSFELMNALFDAGDDLDQTPFWVLMSICWHARDDQRQGRATCWPSVKRIAKKAHVSELTARKAIKHLLDRGLITAQQPPGGVRTFTIRLDLLKELSGGKEVHPLKDVEPPKDLEGGKDFEVPPLKILTPSPSTSLPTPLKDLYPEPVSEQVKEQGREQGKEQVVGSLASELTPPPPSDDDIEAMSAGEDLFTAAGKKVEPLKEEKPKKQKRCKPKVPCPFSLDDYLPDDWRAEFSAKYPTVDLDHEFAKFVSHAIANDIRHAVWKAAFHTWCRNSLKWAAEKKSANRNQPQRRPYVPGDRKFSYATLDTSQFDYEG